MGVKKYQKGKRVFWQLDTWITFPDGRRKRLKKAGIGTREMAEALEHKWKSDAFEGRYFNRPQENTLTVREAWENYKPVSCRSNKHSTYQRNKDISKHLLEHLADVKAVTLTQRHIDEYRTRRESEPTRFKAPPKPGTVNREVALLKRILNYAVKRGDLVHNRLSGVEMLEEDNVRQVAINEAQFSRLYEAADSFLKPILVMAFDTGMRLEEILNLPSGQQRHQVQESAHHQDNRPNPGGSGCATTLHLRLRVHQREDWNALARYQEAVSACENGSRFDSHPLPRSAAQLRHERQETRCPRIGHHEDVRPPNTVGFRTLQRDRRG